MVVALSGGGDSVALAKLAAVWAKPRGIVLHAVCVNHGLRPNSGVEASQAIAWAREFGLSGEVITLPTKPKNGGVQAWARESRYQALARSAHKIGAPIILVGHTLDDQIETLIWRLVRNTGLDGLAGMQALAPCPGSYRFHPCLLARPMLGAKREDLRRYLQAQGQTWLEDDSNHNHQFSRVKIRNRLAELSALGVSFERIITIAALANQLRLAQEQACWALLRRANFVLTETGASLEASPFLNGHSNEVTRGLGWIIYGLSEAKHMVPSAKLMSLHHSLMDPTFRGRTLAGLSIERTNMLLVFNPARPRRGQGQQFVISKWEAQRRILAISRQSHAFVTTGGAIRAGDGLTSCL
ncbi:hypothetical protein PsB1_1153 [Candidatus Phycosocius spiralis]|uniref:tRNA(Ile)-lysidine synthase n=2 Tax=Candidatus Phycosocius spiralis TaxID=2815099 RepID=A0ABQ4PWH0_9PROT|nr:hypothetical protein PsB1_1153 [Candidatus Phycosocius spiralis]